MQEFEEAHKGRPLFKIGLSGPEKCQLIMTSHNFVKMKLSL